jgi:hypothetical protein
VALVNEGARRGEGFRGSGNRGCPFGGEEWRAAIVEALGLDSTMRARGGRQLCLPPFPFSFFLPL